MKYIKLTLLLLTLFAFPKISTMELNDQKTLEAMSENDLWKEFDRVKEANFLKNYYYKNEALIKQYVKRLQNALSKKGADDSAVKNMLENLNTAVSNLEAEPQPQKSSEDISEETVKSLSEQADEAIKSQKSATEESLESSEAASEGEDDPSNMISIFFTNLTELRNKMNLASIIPDLTKDVTKSESWTYRIDQNVKAIIDLLSNLDNDKALEARKKLDEAARSYAITHIIPLLQIINNPKEVVKTLYDKIEIEIPKSKAPSKTKEVQKPTAAPMKKPMTETERRRMELARKYAPKAAPTKQVQPQPTSEPSETEETTEEEIKKSTTAPMKKTMTETERRRMELARKYAPKK